MDIIFSKLRGQAIMSHLQSVSTVQEETALADEQDITTGDISGTLTISDECMKSPTDFIKDSSSDQVPWDDSTSYQVPCDGTNPTSSNVTFEVISAEVIRDGRSGHVVGLPAACLVTNYTVLINPHQETARSAESVVVRRYSDFEQLHHRLKKKFPAVMSQISFPRKVLTGNFTSETIAKRSTAFEQYLAHLFSFFEIRYSCEFMEFFVQDDFSVAVSLFLNKDFNSAASYFEKILPVLDKLYGDSHPHVFHCLCGLVVSYMSVDKYSLAQSCAEMALQCSGAADEEMVISLLLTTIRLCWTLGKDKQDLEKRLESMRSRGVNVHAARDLQDVLQDTFYLSNQNT